MRRVGILTEIFREYHSPNKRNCRSLKASLRLVVAGHNVITKQFSFRKLYCFFIELDTSQATFY